MAGTKTLNSSVITHKKIFENENAKFALVKKQLLHAKKNCLDLTINVVELNKTVA